MYYHHMTFTPEIKKFTINTVLFTVIFAIAINFAWEYFSSLNNSSAQAYNEKTFENANITFI